MIIIIYANFLLFFYVISVIVQNFFVSLVLILKYSQQHFKIFDDVKTRVVSTFAHKIGFIAK